MDETGRQMPQGLTIIVADYEIFIYSLYIVVAAHGGFSAVSQALVSI